MLVGDEQPSAGRPKALTRSARGWPRGRGPARACPPSARQHGHHEGPSWSSNRGHRPSPSSRPSTALCEPVARRLELGEGPGAGGLRSATVSGWAAACAEAFADGPLRRASGKGWGRGQDAAPGRRAGHHRRGCVVVGHAPIVPGAAAERPAVPPCDIRPAASRDSAAASSGCAGRPPRRTLHPKRHDATFLPASERFVAEAVELTASRRGPDTTSHHDLRRLPQTMGRAEGLALQTATVGCENSGSPTRSRGSGLGLAVPRTCSHRELRATPPRRCPLAVPGPAVLTFDARRWAQQHRRGNGTTSADRAAQPLHSIGLLYSAFTTTAGSGSTRAVQAHGAGPSEPTLRPSSSTGRRPARRRLVHAGHELLRLHGMR